MASNNSFSGDPFIKLRNDRRAASDIETPIEAFSLSGNDKVMKKDNVVVRFVHIGKRFTGEIQFKIDEHPDRDVWYKALEDVMAENDRITMLTYEQRQMVEFPISITLEESESHENVINEFHAVIMHNKP